MVRVVIVGGGWSGCAAAVGAYRAGSEVTVLERTDMLLGTGLVGGIMRNNGRYTAAEEMTAMGAGDLFKICDNCSRHTGVEFPGHKHASLYDIAKTHGEVLSYLKELGIKIRFMRRIAKVHINNGTITAVEDQDGATFKGDVFIDATGTAGPQGNCIKFGNGCAMCVIRCPSFGGRVSLAALAGVREYAEKRKDGSYGSMSGSCKLFKESLSLEIQDELNSKGVAVIPIPRELVKDHLDIKTCQQYAIEEFKDNLVLLDTGHAKLMAPYFDLESLRQMPGFENCRYEDPYAGGIGNSIRFTAMVPRDNYMKVEGITNLFCCGEKAGPLVGHTEAIVTGTLAGHNSARLGSGKDLLDIPRSLATGDAIACVKEEMDSEVGTIRKYTFSGSVYFERMKELELYTLDPDTIRKRVKDAGMTGVFSTRVN